MNDLNEFLTEKRAKLSAFMEAAAADPKPIDFSARVEVRGRSGVRVIRIRQFELINDTEAFIGGFDLGPNSPEHMLAAIGGCIAHTAESIAAMMSLSIEEISVDVSGKMHPLAQTAGYEHIPRTPYSLCYSLRICSSEPADRIAELHSQIEAVCPILNLIKRPQQIEGRMEHVQS